MCVKAETALPKFWFTRFSMEGTPARFALDFEVGQPGHVSDRKVQVDRQIAYSDAARNMQPYTGDFPPTFLYFSQGTQIAQATKDAFISENGLMIVSPAVRDVLVQFELGASQLIEVPVYRDMAGTPSEYPPHFVLHVMEHKSCFVPEASLNVEQPPKWDGSPPDPDKKWRGIYRTDTPALRAFAADGADMWCDPILRHRIFVSDRLKQALDAARIKSQGLKFFEAITLSETTRKTAITQG